jgi:methionyl aminopeptidase
MRRAGRVVAEIHEVLFEAIRPGQTGLGLDALARAVLERRHAGSNFLGYGSPPFPAVICVSVNGVVVHGIPSATPFEEGDLVSVDCGAIVDGYHGDAAFTAGVGRLAEADERLLVVTAHALAAGVAAARDGAHLHDIGRAVQRVVEAAGFGVVRDYVGHGIGRAMHEPPDVPNFWPGRPGPRLRTGVALAIEPMVAAGTGETVVAPDGWAVLTADGTRAAHFEHTVLVGPEGGEVLTTLGPDRAVGTPPGPGAVERR